MKYLIKIDRFCAWILLFGMLLYFISGYGMTKSIIDPVLATKLHIDWLSMIILFAFIFHTGFATRLALMRWKIWNTATKSFWVLFFAIFLTSFIYIDHIYKKPNKTITQAESQYTDRDEADSGTPTMSLTPTTINIPTPTTSASQENVFTKDKLAKYNGQNGASAYVAVDGIVYDMSRVFREGTHFSHLAGTELTNAFYSYHIKSAITKYPIVGTYNP